jgi:hypothetical protein
MLVYEPSKIRSWKNSPDWINKGGRHDEPVSKIIGAMLEHE